MERGNKEREDRMIAEASTGIVFAHGLILGGILAAFAMFVGRK